MGRPRSAYIRPEDEPQLRKLAEMHCTETEIAAFFDVPKTTLLRWHKPIIDASREAGKEKLRHAMWVNAVEKNNVVMQIWLSKNLLGMREPRTEITQENITIDPKDFFTLKVVTAETKHHGSI